MLSLHINIYFIKLTECTESAACPAGARAGHCTRVDGQRLLVGAGEREGVFILLKQNK